MGVSQVWAGRSGFRGLPRADQVARVQRRSLRLMEPLTDHQPRRAPRGTGNWKEKMTNPTSVVQINNAEVTVTRWTLMTGESTGRHRHEYDYVVVPMAPARMNVVNPDGTQTHSDLQPGSSYYRAAGAEHTVSNDQEAVLDFVEVEILGQQTGAVDPQGIRVVGVRVRPPEPADFPRWRALYQGYADFYGVDQQDESARRVWSWIHDPNHEVQALVATDSSGSVVGLAHYRPFSRPLSATVGCWLDDLYVDPESRGSGAADALLAELTQLAKNNHWSVVRWITADNNHRARSKYDQVAARTQWITYDMPPQAD